MKTITFVCFIALCLCGIAGCLLGALWGTHVVAAAGHDPETLLFGRQAFYGSSRVTAGTVISREDSAAGLRAAGYTEVPASSTAKLRPGTFELKPGALDYRDGGENIIHVQWSGAKIVSVNDPNGNLLTTEFLNAHPLLRLPNVNASGALESRFATWEDLPSIEEIRDAVLTKVLLAAEDRNFYHSGGTEAGVIFGIMKRAIVDGKLGGGGPIEGQLARNLYLHAQEPAGVSWKKLRRKIRELFLAGAIASSQSKDDSLRLYMGSANQGRVRTNSGRIITLRGFKASARAFFGVTDLRKLSVGQACELVGVLPHPNRKPTDPKKKRDICLKEVAETFPELRAAVQTAKNQPLARRIVPNDTPSEEEAAGSFLNAWRHDPGFDAVRHNQALQSTMDPALQRAAVSAMQKTLPGLQAHTTLPLYAALIAIDPFTGAVRALVNGDRFSAFDMTGVPHETGSAKKPFDNAKALDEGQLNGQPVTSITPLPLDYSSCTIDGDTRIAEASSKPDKLRNRVRGVQSLNNRYSLAQSENCGAVQIAKSLGMAKDCAEIKLALQNDPECNAMMVIGQARGSATTMRRLAEAYAAFVNGGERVAAHFGYSDSPGRRVRLFSPQAAYVELEMMESVVGNGPAIWATAQRARKDSGLPLTAAIAGKTGTDSTNDLIFVEISPALVTVVLVHVGQDVRVKVREIDGFTGGHFAEPIWAAFARAAYAARPEYFDGQFFVPQGIVLRAVDRDHNCLRPGSSDQDAFIVGREPSQCQ